MPRSSQGQHEHAHREQDRADHEVDDEEGQEEQEAHLERRLQLIRQGRVDDAIGSSSAPSSMAW